MGAPGRHAGRAARAHLGERRHRKRRVGWGAQRGERSKRPSFWILCFPALPFQARLAGTVTSAPGPASGDSTVTLAMADGSAVRLKIVISGPAAQGGVAMTASSVQLGPASAPTRYAGHVVAQRAGQGPS
jgi:hypothetical protein